MDVNILLYMEAFKHSVFIYNSCSFSHANFNLFPFHWNTVLKPQCEGTYWSPFPTDYSVGVIVTVSALIVILTWITSVQRNIIFTNQQQFHEQSTVMYFVVEHRLAYKWLSCSAFNSRLCCIGNKTHYTGHQICSIMICLSPQSLEWWCIQRQLGSRGKKCNHDIGDLQVGTLERGPRFWVGWRFQAICCIHVFAWNVYFSQMLDDSIFKGELR